MFIINLTILRWIGLGVRKNLVVLVIVRVFFLFFLYSRKQLLMLILLLEFISLIIIIMFSVLYFWGVIGRLWFLLIMLALVREAVLSLRRLVSLGATYSLEKLNRRFY